MLCLGRFRHRDQSVCAAAQRVERKFIPPRKFSESCCGSTHPFLMTPAVISRRERWLLLLSFAAIYIIWGSTYLAIRFAVESIPPLVVAGVRHLTAGTVLFVWAYARGYRPTAREMRACAVLGVFFFLM